MAMKGYSACSKSPVLLEPHRLMTYPGQLLVGDSYLSVEMQSVYSTAFVDWAERKKRILNGVVRS